MKAHLKLRDFKLRPLRSAVALSVALAVTVTAGSLNAAIGMGFGESRLSSAIGRPLEFLVDVILDPNTTFDRSCFAATVMAGESQVPSSDVFVHLVPGAPGHATAHVRTSIPVNEPVLSVSVISTCPRPIVRRYVVFLDPPVEDQLADGRPATAAPPVVLPFEAAGMRLTTDLADVEPAPAPAPRAVRARHAHSGAASHRAAPVPHIMRTTPSSLALDLDSHARFDAPMASPPRPAPRPLPAPPAREETLSVPGERVVTPLPTPSVAAVAGPPPDRTSAAPLDAPAAPRKFVLQPAAEPVASLPPLHQETPADVRSGKAVDPGELSWLQFELKDLSERQIKATAMINSLRTELRKAHAAPKPVSRDLMRAWDYFWAGLSALLAFALVRVLYANRQTDGSWDRSARVMANLRAKAADAMPRRG